MKLLFKLIFLVLLGSVHAQDLSSLYIEQSMNVTMLLPEIKGLADESGNFGASIAIDNEYMVAAAPGNHRGGVAIYKKTVNDWQLVQMIDGASLINADEFGGSVDISGNRLVIGGHLSTFNNEDEGAVFVYELENNTWIYKKTLFSPNSRYLGNFGSKVVIKGNMAVIAEESGNNVPAVFYVYHINGSDWQLVNQISDMDLEWQQGASFLNIDFNDDYMVLSRYLSATLPTVRVYELNNGLPQSYQVLENPELTVGFGSSLSIDNDRIAIADYTYNSDAGVVYIYERNQKGWYLAHTIYGPNADQDKEFGAFVKLKDNRLLIGSYGDDEVTSGAGAVFYYSYDGQDWLEQQKILASDGDVYDNFGAYADFYNNDLVIGSHRADASINNSGKVYSFSLNNNSWNENQIILPLPAAFQSWFSNGLALNNNWVVVGADGDNDFGERSGAVYLYKKDQNQLNFIEKMYATEPTDQQQFGKNIVIDDDIMLISATGNVVRHGYVHFYRLIEDEWTYQSKFKPDDIAETDYFGYALSLDNDFLAVSALEQVNGSDTGAVYLFRLDNNSWLEETKILVDSTVDIGSFGYDLSLKGNRLAVGTLFDGQVFVFENTGGLWAQTQSIVYPESMNPYTFGQSIELFDNKLFVSTEFSPFIYEFNGINLSEPIFLDDTIDRAAQRHFNINGNKLVLITPSNYSAGFKTQAKVYEYINDSWQFIHEIQKPQLPLNFYNDVSVFGNEVLIGSMLNSQRGYQNGAAYWINGMGDLIYKNGFE